MNSETRPLSVPSDPSGGRVRRRLARPLALLAGAGLIALGLPAVAGAATSPPSVTSAFVPSSIGVGGTTALSITITNPNSSGR